MFSPIYSKSSHIKWSPRISSPFIPRRRSIKCRPFTPRIIAPQSILHEMKTSSKTNHIKNKYTPLAKTLYHKDSILIRRTLSFLNPTKNTTRFPSSRNQTSITSEYAKFKASWTVHKTAPSFKDPLKTNHQFQHGLTYRMKSINFIDFIDFRLLSWN